MLIALGLEQDGVHETGRLNASRHSLEELRSAYFGTIGQGSGIVGHIL
jgi:hypothetical protein